MNAHSRVPAPPAPRVTLSPNIRKIVAAISFLIKEAERKGASVTQYHIVKALFFADREHLNRYGRPITYDNYYAMFHGPVPSLAYDLLKTRKVTLEEYGIVRLPWTKVSAEHVGSGCFHYRDAVTSDDEIMLSESDIKSLSGAIMLVLNSNFTEIRRLTHGDASYQEAWKYVSDKTGSNAMSFGLLFDKPNFAIAEEVAFKSRQAAFRKSENDEFAPPTDLDIDSGPEDRDDY